ncbi:MAG: PQQ-binding-like beta-propeller repeat protein [Planctomycetota bacterium]
MALGVLALLSCLGSAGGGEGGAARQLLDESGVQGGLVVHVGGGSPQRTAALRANRRYVVQALGRQADRVGVARAFLRRQGLLGPVTAIRWDGKRLPYADSLVDLLIVEPAEGLPPDEIQRVLAPHGVVWVRSDGEWQKREKPQPKDIDEWTHFLHAPDNNAVADDTRIGPPRYLQWVAGPRYGRSHDHLASLSAAVSAAGRLFYIIDEGPIASVKAPARWMLVARDAFNGLALWRKPIGPWEDHLRPFRSGPAELPRRLVAVGDRVYVTLGYGKPVTALDAATGEGVRTYEGSENTHEILCCDGRLFLVVCDPLKEESPTTGQVLRRFSRWRGAYAEYVVQYPPKHIRVLDSETGKVAWTKDDEEAERILPLTLAVAGGRVFFQNPTHLVALEAASGKVLWRAERPAVRRRYAWLTPTLVVNDGVVLSADRSPE